MNVNTQVTQLRFEAASGHATMVAYLNAQSPWSPGWRRLPGVCNRQRAGPASG
jgi:hypothetical protein